MGEAILDSLIDTAKLIPLLYLTYLAMEYIESRAGSKSEGFLRRAGRLGPLFGGLVGAIPQCGLAAAGSSLYAGRVISVGTLVALFLSASDEMLPILISSAAPIELIIRILALKAVIGMIVGFLADLALRTRFDGKLRISELCEKSHCGCESESIFLSALKHTAKTILFVFIVSLVISLTIYFIGEENLTAFATATPVLSELICSAVGLIPNCASSVALTQLYLEGIISGGAMLAGLLSCSGVGILVLFKTNKNLKENLRVTAIIYVAGVVFGLLAEWTGIL